MSAHSFPEAEVWSKRQVAPGELIVLGLAFVALAVVAGAFFFGSRSEPPAPALSVTPDAPPPAVIRARPLPPRPRPAAPRSITIHHAEPAPALPEIDPFDGVERVSPAEMDAISQAD
ncbi:MAG TPA: hypothetical protein VG943_05030 [Caulobacterales bacterium]|nr:hypothetical protein [Caulobacterales bacterium]